MAEKKLTEEKTKQIQVIKKIMDYKVIDEANIVSIFWNNPSFMYDYDNISLNSFHDNMWKVYYQIAYDIYIVEKKESIDEITVNLYLKKHPKLKNKYDEYGGWDKISKTKEYIKEENLEGYIQSLYKWHSVIKLIYKGFPLNEDLSKFVDMSIQDIYEYYEANINDIFSNTVNHVKSYDISDGIYELIDELDEGMAVGLPYHNLELLNQETSGSLVGNMTLIGGVSNVGKSSLIRTALFPSIIEHDERIVVIINEEGVKKWQREMLVWVTNNIFKKDLPKHIVRDGKYTQEYKDILKQSAEWLLEKKQNKTITLIPLDNYKTETAIKIIKKYASLHVNYFVLDTFKIDSGIITNNTRLQLTQNSVALYDTIKESVKNVHLTATFQLSQDSQLHRYFTQKNIGESKTIVNVASTCLMIRKMYDDEFPGKKNELKVYRLSSDGKSKIPVEINKDKHYQIIFIVKNREGSANEYQIVIEHDLSKNLIKEMGFTKVPHEM